MTGTIIYADLGGYIVCADKSQQETLNFWKQIPHVMKYFRETENPTARLPDNFMQAFLEVEWPHRLYIASSNADSVLLGSQLRKALVMYILFMNSFKLVLSQATLYTTPYSQI